MKMRAKRVIEKRMRVNLIVIDAETREQPDGTLVLRLAVVRNGNKYIVCRTIEDVSRTILKFLRVKLLNLVVAHNLQFDIFFVDKEILEREGFQLKFIATRPCIFKYSRVYNQKERKYTNLVFFDTLNYFKNNLEELGETFSLPKLKIDFNNCTDEELEIYCKRDVDITYKIMSFILKMHREYSIKRLCISISQLSFNIFRKEFLKIRLKPPRHKYIMRLERESYRGGRTEVFRHGEYKDRELYYYDVNSMYPHVMRENRFPTSVYALYRRENLKGLSLDKIKHLIDKFLEEGKLVIVRCHVGENTNYPIIGVRDDERRLIFPKWKDAVICTPEYLRCKDNITRIDEFVVYNSDYIFREFVTYFYDKRMSTEDPVMNLFYKLILNSLYGKFGQRRFKTKVFEYEPDFFDRNGEVDITEIDDTFRRGKVLLGYYVEESVDEMNPRAFVAIASHVTAYARCLLSEEIGDDTYYCDTDSIITSVPLPSKKVGKKLGQWKLEKVSYHSIFKAPKHYFFAGKWKRKGIPKNAEQIGDDTFSHERFTKFKETYRRYGGKIRKIKEIKVLKGEDKKRIHNPDGTTSPFPIIPSHSCKTRARKSP